MTKVMTPSHEPMTDGQITKAVDHYRAMLQKHRGEIGSSDAVQQMLGSSEYLTEQLSVIRKRVEAMSKIIVRRVKVNRNRTPQEVLDATGRVQYTDKSVFAAMPRGEGDEADVYFFKPEPWEYTRPEWMSEDDLEKAFDRRNLKPADPYSQAAVHEEDSSFADEHPNGTHWKDENGNWNFSAFIRWNVKRGVSVGRYGGVWGDYWWFAGLRK